MTTPRATQPLRDEHAELLPHVAALQSLADAAGAESAELRQPLEEALAFLRHHLLPHAAAEGAVLYPEVARLLGAPQATATMERDHAEVQRLADELAVLAAAPSPTRADRRKIQRLAWGLYAILQLHFAKEEEIYLPLLDAHLDAEVARALFTRMEAAASAARGT